MQINVDFSGTGQAVLRKLPAKLRSIREGGKLDGLPLAVLLLILVVGVL